MVRLFPPEPGAQRRRDRVLGALFVLLLAFLVVRAGRKDGGVLVRNQQFGARFLAGEDPYVDPVRGQRVHGPYPPSFALVAAPLSLLPTPAARVAWALAQAFALVAAFVLLRRLARRAWPEAAPHATVLYAAALLLASRYLLRDFAGGGGNLLYAVLALAGLELALTGRERLAGLPLALSLVLKPNLAPLLLFLALRRRLGAIASTVGAAAVLFCLPAIAYGPARYLDLSTSWARGVVAYASLDDLGRADLVPAGMPEPLAAMNQSLREAVHRFLRPPGDSGAPDVHVLETSPAVAAGIARTLGAALGIAAAFMALRASPGRSEALAALGFLPLAMLLSPISWKAHHVALLPLFFALSCEARTRRPLAAMLAGYWVACDLLSEEIVGGAGKELLQSLSVVTAGDLALLAATWIAVRRARH